MSRIRVTRTIRGDPAAVWRAIEDVTTHVAWMDEAIAIRARPGRTRGAGAVFECDTRVGPLRVTDVFEITEWVPGRRMGVRHVGAVTGTGVFTLRRHRRGTRFTWRERLVFPWWLGGPVGAVIGGELLRAIWRRNLANLARLVEARG